MIEDSRGNLEEDGGGLREIRDKGDKKGKGLGGKWGRWVFEDVKEKAGKW